VKQHGITPTAARHSGVNFNIYPPLTFQIQIKGVQKMNWRIEEKEEFEVFGIERIFKNDESNKIPAFWDETRDDGSRIKLVEQAGGYGPIAICGHIDNYEDAFPYMICCVVRDGCRIDDFKVVQIPKATWAVFRLEKMKDHDDCKIPELFHRAYSEWLPSSGYNKAIGPDMEIYGDNYEEVWIPVIKKQSDR
jgi:AraC family transcriptional regulator